MKFISSMTAALTVLATIVTASNVVDLDSGNFDKYVGGSQPALVEFFAPWCGHCKNLAPVYEQLADAFPSSKVVIAKTDADGVGRSLGEKYGVTGYPTECPALKWFPAGSTEPKDYTGGRDLDSLAAFVTKEAGIKSSIKPPPPPAAVQLTASNFDDIALNKDKNVLVAFTAPWCGHCKNMKPAYEKVATAFKSESDCVVAQMDADEEDNKPVATKYGVRSFPTIQFFPKGSNQPIPYNLGRTEEQFIDFLNENCGTHRSTSGLLNDLAGKVLPLDTLASDFFSAAIPDRADVLAKARESLSGLTGLDKRSNSSAEYYIKAMERIVEKGENWLTKEQARIAKMLGSPSLAPTKLDELKIKANILSSFAYKKVEEVFGDAQEMAGDAIQFADDAAQKVYKAGEDVADAAKEAVKKVKVEL